MTSPLQSFVIGSSILVALPHLYATGFLLAETVTFNMKRYFLIVPLYFGLMNALSNWLGRRNNWNLGQRLGWISLLSILIFMVVGYAYARHHYLPYKNFQLAGWVRYLILNGLMHFLVFRGIIYGLESLFH